MALSFSLYNLSILIMLHMIQVFNSRPSPCGIQKGRVRTSCHLIAEGSGKTRTLQISRSSPRPCGCERNFEPISLSVLPIYQIFSSGITVQSRSVNMSVFRSCLSFLPVFSFSSSKYRNSVDNTQTFRRNIADSLCFFPFSGQI